MAKRKFAALMLASIGALAFTNNVRAGEPFIGVDGCAVLAELVYTEITAAAWYGPGDFSAWPRSPGATDITICNQTARTVSKAFTSAMTSIGKEVRWGLPSINPGDVCQSGFLEQCYPDRYPFDAPNNTWGTLSKIVQQAMPFGSASDQAIFSSEAMRRALRSALARN